MAQGEIGDGHRRQVEIEGLPVSTVVEGHEHAQFGSCVEHARVRRIFAHHAYKSILRQALIDAFPALAVIAGLVDVWFKVIQLVAGDCQVCRGLVVGADLNGIDHGLARMFGGDIFPIGAAIACDVHQAIVTADPDQVFLVR